MITYNIYRVKTGYRTTVYKILKTSLYNYIHSSMKIIFYMIVTGFRAKYSTEFAALDLNDRIVTKMDKNYVPINKLFL